MDDAGDAAVDGLRERVAQLEAENARLRRVEAAAKEARAFYEGRRPGFGPSYPADVLRAALDAGTGEGAAFPVVRGGWNARRRRPKPK